MDKSNLQFNFRGCSSKTCTSFECRRTSTTLFSEKNAMHTLWRYRSPTSTSYISALGMNRSKIQTVSETRGFYCYEKWPLIKQPKKDIFFKISRWYSPVNVPTIYFIVCFIVGVKVEVWYWLYPLFVREYQFLYLVYCWSRWPWPLTVILQSLLFRNVASVCLSFRRIKLKVHMRV